jgi:hypothetical protein
VAQVYEDDIWEMESDEEEEWQRCGGTNEGWMGMGSDGEAIEILTANGDDDSSTCSYPSI